MKRKLYLLGSVFVMAGLGPMGVFLAEPVSNFVGGAACYGTMIRTVWPELGRKKEKA